MAYLPVWTHYSKGHLTVMSGYSPEHDLDLVGVRYRDHCSVGEPDDAEDWAELEPGTAYGLALQDAARRVRAWRANGCDAVTELVAKEHGLSLEDAAVAVDVGMVDMGKARAELGGRG